MRRKRGALVYDPARHRLREIERLIQSRHGVVPDTDDADMYLVPVARLLRRLCELRVGPGPGPDVLDRLQVWAQRFAPAVAEHRLEDAARTAMRCGLIERADAIAARLRVTYAERQRLKLTTIGSYDVNKAGRKRRRLARKRERDRQRAAAKRAAAGAMSREQYLAQSLSAARPWQTEGISRRTWYRRRKTAVGTGPSPTIDLHAGRRTCAIGTARRRGNAAGTSETGAGIDAA